MADTIIKGTLETSPRLYDEDIANIEDVIKEIHKQIDEHKKKKLDLIYFKLQQIYPELMKKYEFPMICNKGTTLEIDVHAIPTLPLSAVVNNTLLIKLGNITINYECEPFEQCLKNILNRLPTKKVNNNMKYITYDIKDDNRYIIKSEFAKNVIWI